MIKKLVSLVCSTALLMAVCVPAFAAGAGADELDENLTLGSATYSLNNNADKTSFETYLAGKDISVLSSAVTQLRTDINEAYDANPSADPDQLWNAVKQNDYSSLRSDLGLKSVTLSYPNITIIDTENHTYHLAVSVSYQNNKDDDNESSDTPGSNSPSTPSKTTTTTGADGKTTVGVTTAPDSAPTVSGGTSSFGVTVPSTAVSTAAAAATAAKHAAVAISAPSDTLISQLNNSAVQRVSMSLKVPSDVAYGTAANVDVSMNLDSSVLQAAKQASKDITVGVVDQLTGKEAYSWSFKGTDLANASAIGSVDMALNVKTATLDSEISGKVPGSEKGVVLTFANNGTLPAPATVRVLVSDQGYQPGQTVHMYYFNSVSKQVETLDASAYTVDADGYVSVVINHCSKYIISSGVIAAVNPAVIDTGKKLSVKAGKTYQFKITATAKPTFKSGNNSVFSVTANGSNGNSYYFKVTAVGKAGQSAGFYVNGEKAPRTIGTII